MFYIWNEEESKFSVDLGSKVAKSSHNELLTVQREILPTKKLKYKVSPTFYIFKLYFQSQKQLCDHKGFF